MTDLLTRTETALAKLSTESDLSQAIDSIEMLDALSARVRDLKAQHKEQLVDYIQENGDIEIGTRRYYVAKEKKTKCRDIPAAVYAMIEHYDGDFERLSSELLASNAIKPGAFKKVMGDEAHAKHFEVTEVPDLKTGKPKKTVGVSDSRFQ